MFLQIITSLEWLVLLLERFEGYLEEQTRRALLSFARDVLARIAHLLLTHGAALAT